ncbi:MAG: TIR domain-containing protein [Chthoniobacterales bacterium]|nr:TIR domain-containing protein [Chthoniobacterales bacterium]
MPAVFISYSRKDFYFAESLAFHLAARGTESWLDANHLTPGAEWSEEIDRALDEAQTVILVATPASLRSPHVEREWKRALAQGDRLVVALFRSCKLPPEIRPCRVVDFRGPFGAALQRLKRLLDEPEEASLRLTKSSRLPRVPPFVALITLMLAAIFLFPLAIFGERQGLNLENETIGFQIFFWVMLPFIAGLVAWHTCLAFLWRRMGLTRLALTLSLFTGLFGLYLLGRTAWIPSVTALTRGMHYGNIPNSILIGIVVIGCAALAIVVLLRPQDLLRWCPTGKAWDAYRRGRVIKIPDLPTRFAELGGFQLLHDVEDEPAAAQLRSDLTSVGATEAPGDGTRVILLTNRTTTEWLSGQADLLQKAAVTVIGSAIGLPESLHWLWRRQWIDLRRWDATRKQKNPVPAVPEGMARLRLPAIVRVSEHLLCAIAGLLAVLANVAFSTNKSQSEDLTPLDWFGVVLAIACTFWIVVAWQLIHRKITQPRYLRMTGVLGWSTLLLAAGGFWVLVSLGGNVWRAMPAVLFVIALPFLLRWQRPRLAFWFPAPPSSGAKFPARLNAPRKWDALLWTFLYMGLWMVLLDLMD